MTSEEYNLDEEISSEKNNLGNKPEESLHKENNSKVKIEALDEENNLKVKPEDSLNRENDPIIKEVKVDDNFEFIKPDIFALPVRPISRVKKYAAKPKLPALNDNVSKPEEQNFRKPSSQKEVSENLNLSYKEPLWSGLPESNYQFEIIKGGVIIENIPLKKPYTVIGRADQCDIKLEHPSISRYHCIVQYKSESNDEADPVGMYLYDLDSTHGTFQNKDKVKPNCYSKLSVGHIVKCGSSTRMLILQGPSDDEDMESPYTVSELKKMREERRLTVNAALEAKENEKLVQKENDGISWGMGEDAIEEDEAGIAENPFASNDELCLDDPKKTLRGWFEREGYDIPDYNIEEITNGHFRCKLDIPLSGTGGQPFVCVVEHKGKKKDTVTQCALEACRIIDQRGLLRQATHEGLAKKRRKDISENDFYESDEDEFLDRTGDIERKRKKRKNDSKMNSNVENFDTLKTKYDAILVELNALELKIKDANVAKELQKQVSEAEDLDEYMSQLSKQVPDRHKIVEWKIQLSNLDKEEFKLRKLLNVARPHTIEEFKERKSILTQENSTVNVTKAKPFTFGKKSSGVHKIFLEDDDSPKLKLSKLDDGNDDVKAVPYSQIQKTISKYQELMILKENKLKKQSALLAESVPRESIINSVATSGIVEKSLTKQTVESVTEPQAVVESAKERVKGPLPENSKNNNDDKDTFQFLKPMVPKLKKDVKVKKASMLEKECVTWQPPMGQSGDGRTSLNDKLGY